MARVETKSYGNDKEILKVLQDYYACPIMVSDTGVTADDLGRKIVPAGTVLNADGVKSNDAEARFVLLRSTDVTSGPREGAGIYWGVIDAEKLPEAPSAEAVASLKGIFFMSTATGKYDYEV